MNAIEKKLSTALILTRPAHQNKQLIEALNESSISPIDYPFIEIEALDDYELFDSIIHQLDAYHYLIFISTNAVKFFADRMNQLSLNLPQKIILASIGQTTRDALQHTFKREVSCPDEIFDSEHLLAHPIFNNIESKNVLIVRGEGGRETLKSGLEKKGSAVAYVECYKRNFLPFDLKKLKEVTKGFKSIAFLITSNESADHLISKIKNEDKDWLQYCCLIVNHEKLEKKLGLIFKKKFVSPHINALTIINIIEQLG